MTKSWFEMMIEADRENLTAAEETAVRAFWKRANEKFFSELVTSFTALPGYDSQKFIDFSKRMSTTKWKLPVKWEVSEDEFGKKVYTGRMLVVEQ